MQTFPRLAIRFSAVLVMLGSYQGSAWADIGALAREMVLKQRQVLVLHETANPEDRAEAKRAGQYLFFVNQQLGRELLTELRSDPAALPQRFASWMAALDSEGMSDEDRLVFRGPLEAVLADLPPKERQQAQQRLDELAATRHVLGADFINAFDAVPLGKRPASPRWAAFIKRLSLHDNAKSILAELDRQITPGPVVNEDDSQAAAKARVLEWNGEELPPRTVLLTFDDGPHPVHTPLILDILKLKGIKAIFFQVGRNLGDVRDGEITSLRNEAIEARIVAEGHAIGNHSFTHPSMPKLNGLQIKQEISETQALLDRHVPTGKARTGTFRPPFGARDDKVLASIEQHRLRSVIWNIDSEDWADPLPRSIAHRVISEAEKYGRGIVLMHDIHARTVEALPIVIQELQARGFRFGYWDGSRLVSLAATH